MTASHLDANEIRRALASTGVQRLAAALGVNNYRLERGGAALRGPCPIHRGTNPAAFVMSEGAAGPVWYCFTGCGTGGDALSLIAAIRGLDLRHDFPEVLKEAAEIVGAGESLPRGSSAPLNRAAQRKPRNRRYLDNIEVTATWESCDPVADDLVVADYLRGRAIDPFRVEDADVARVLNNRRPPPDWMRIGKLNWLESNHRLVVPLWDARGQMKSLRGWCVSPSNLPKRLAPAGYSASGLVMADALALQLLRTGTRPSWWPSNVPLDVIVAEGEPDFVSYATHRSDADETAPAVFGVESGSWTEEIASRIPFGARVLVAPHHDPAGQSYARKIAQSLSGRAQLLRSAAVKARTTP